MAKVIRCNTYSNQEYMNKNMTQKVAADLPRQPPN